MEKREHYIERLIREGNYSRECAERSVTLIEEDDHEVDIEQIIDTLIDFKRPKIDNPFRQQ